MVAFPLAYVGYNMTSFTLLAMKDKYLGDLDDYELGNFEEMYRARKE